MADLYVQRDQPEGVPPLHLTGERTLPDVPEENYWFRRHLVVYEWIAARAHGRRVVDLACGEGYGSAVLGRTAASVVGVVFLQTIEHVQDADAVLARIRELIGPGGVAYVSTPNVLTLAGEGQAKSGTCSIVCRNTTQSTSPSHSSIMVRSKVTTGSRVYFSRA